MAAPSTSLIACPFSIAQLHDALHIPVQKPGPRLRQTCPVPIGPALPKVPAPSSTLGSYLPVACQYLFKPQFSPGTEPSASSFPGGPRCLPVPHCCHHSRGTWGFPPPTSCPQRYLMPLTHLSVYHRPQDYFSLRLQINPLCFGKIALSSVKTQTNTIWGRRDGGEHDRLALAPVEAARHSKATHRPPAPPLLAQLRKKVTTLTPTYKYLLY